MPEIAGAIERLPTCVFAIMNAMKHEATRKGEGIIDPGLGNPDHGSLQHIVNKFID